MKWLYSLFTKHKEKPTRKKSVRLHKVYRDSLVTDVMINKMSYGSVAAKYSVAESTARKIVSKARNER